MTKRKQITAIYKYNDNVSQLLTGASTFYNILGTAPASGHTTITSSELIVAKGRIADAHLAEIIAGTGAMGLAAARDLAVDLVIADIRNFVMRVQTAANNVLDEATATAIVTECGLITKRPKTLTKGPFAVINDIASPGLITFNFKATPKGVNACYETQVSTDNVNWTPIKTSTDSTYSFEPDVATGTQLYFRGRVILSEKKGGAMAWMSPPKTFIFLY